jgi:hypothetical protein
LDSHISGDVLTWYLKECLLEAKQNFICVGNPLKKPTIWNKIEPLISQKVGLKNGQPRETRLKCFIVPSIMKKW